MGPTDETPLPRADATGSSSALAGVDIVLVRTEGPLNLGSVARLCGNFGCGLRLVDVRADAGSRECVMMAHPSERVLADAPRFATLKDALVDIELAVGTSSKIAAARDGPGLDVERARALLPAAGRRTAFVLGNERTGLLLDEAELCQRVIRLEAPGPEPSLNLSHAAAAILTILALARVVDDEPRASAAAKEALAHEWLGALESVGFFKQNTPASFAPRLREILDRMDVNDSDVDLLRGMMRVLAKGRGP